MTNRIVIDTNVIVSALLTPNGNPAQVLKCITSGKMQICLNAQIFAEYVDVLFRPKLKLDKIDTQNLLDILCMSALIVTPEASHIALTDEDDRIFYDTAKACDALLVTGNIRHYPDEPFIMTPAQLITKIDDKG
jgi:putative PIN family toxin of toxin-antitoxin system